MANYAATIWEKFYETLKKCPEKEQPGLALAMLDFAFTGQHKQLSLIQDVAITPMKPSLILRNMGGAPRGNLNNRKSTVVQPLTNRCTTVDITPPDKSSQRFDERCIEKSSQQQEQEQEQEQTFANAKVRAKRVAFVQPTVEDVKKYCYERNNGVDPEAFVAFYASKGWKVGSQPMRDWKMAVITWEKRNCSGGAAAPADDGLDPFGLPPQNQEDER